MANRDDDRGYRGGGGREAWRRDGQRPQSGRGEQRSFGEEGRFNSDEARYGSGWRGGVGDGEQEPWRRDRYGSRFDQDRADYGSGYDPNRGDYGRGQAEDASRFGANYGGGYEGGYGGQEYGIEGHGGGNRRGEQYGAPQDYRNRQQQQQPQQARQQHAQHEFDTDYVHWREEQLRIHDRDYQDWRRHQQEQHDDEYRKFRTERRDTFGRNFLDWRSQRTSSPGVAQPDTRQESHDFHSREPASLAGGRTGSQPAAGQAAGGSEFAKTPTQVQAAADGSTGRSDEGDNKDKKGERH